MDLDAFDELARSYPGVRRRTVDGRPRWQFDGRLIARVLDGDRVVVRVPFDARDLLQRTYPDSFSVPKRFAKHMMVVADLAEADPEGIDDAVRSAWRLQREHGAGTG